MTLNSPVAMLMNRLADVKRAIAQCEVRVESTKQELDTMLKERELLLDAANELHAAIKLLEAAGGALPLLKP